MRLNKENTIAVVIDMQEKLLPHMSNKEQVFNNCLKIVKGLRILSVPIIVTQQYTKGLGNTVQEINQAIGNFSYIEKLTFSCYREPSFIKILNRSSKRNVIILGIESHVCIMQTALDLLYNNFNPVIITDSVSSRNEYDKEVSLWRMRDVGCIMTTTESILFELCRQAGTSEFKEISNLVK
ncbi:MAG: hydrolase [Bacteroidales bacterium]|nr:hydrolase [Bacteroidales bacterium]MBN2821189.1 hydrolase [Bacteroidales bacterium]